MSESVQPNNELNVLLSKGFLLLQGKLMQSAGHEFKKALELDPKQASTLFNQHFGLLLQKGAFEEALNLGKFIVIHSPRNYVIYNHMGNCARRLKLREAADKYYNRAIKLKPDYQKPYLNIGANGAKLELYDVQVESFINRWIPTRVLVLPPYQGDKNLIQKLTEVIEEEGGTADSLSIKEALTHRIKTRWKISDADSVQQIIQQDQFNASLYAIKTEDYQRAVELLSRLIEQSSAMPEIEVLLCLAKNFLDNSTENLQELFELQEKSPYDRALNLNIGVCCLNNGHIAHGYHYLCNGAHLLSKSKGLYRFAEIISEARASAEHGSFEEAIALYQEAFLIHNRIEITAEIAKLYQRNDQHDLALESFLELKKQAPDHELTRSTLQEVHDVYLKKADDQLDEQQFTTALATNKRAESLLRQIATVHQKARILRVLSRPDEAEPLDAEVAAMKIKEAKAKVEAQRQALILGGKKMFRAKDYMKATQLLEQALLMKKDQGIFLLIAGIYKNLKHKRALNDLLFRWKSMPDPVEEPEEEPVEPLATQEEQGNETEENRAAAEPAAPSFQDEIASRPQFDMDF